jgi:hypothetical protein
MYFHLDDRGNPGVLHPLTQLEHVEAYWSSVDDNPNSLADLYLNFHDFDRIEFVLFKDRLSAAILVARSAGSATSQLRAGLEQQRQDGSHLIPGWEAESDNVLDDSLGVVRDAQEIAIGATILTAVAALELLLKELSTGAGGRSGLEQTLKHFLARQAASPDEAKRIIEMVSKVRRRRNSFAHALTGSYWDRPTAGEMFTPESMDDTLFTVAQVAIALEALIGRRNNTPHPPDIRHSDCICAALMQGGVRGKGACGKVQGRLNGRIRKSVGTRPGRSPRYLNINGAFTLKQVVPFQ